MDARSIKAWWLAFMGLALLLWAELDNALTTHAQPITSWALSYPIYTFAGMKHLLLSALLLGLAGCGGSGGQANTEYKPTATDSAANGLYKLQPRPAGLPRR